ncbi:Uncharacterized membrane protein YcaP, DUF421 family [Thalassobacillus cyri]|uniref:Uncharacterized membrane protein YcaP, DUF421 family n=1 Tax=Thalassobacillus cyri TaxID=571932 RepID=A0A1H3XW97_9BACI|nr:DUF421 domain-containing protein [Thalassobacillus cyri]SEA03729.1 Uncharacterized membrane protein YcaP, DUF421 family [Thalassobacillus cyri]
MLEIVKESLLVLGRISTIVPLMLITAIFMGKRAIGELPIFDLLIILTLGSVVGADIADPSVNHIPTAVAIIALGLSQKLVAKLKISSRSFGRWITFKPTVVIQNGKFINENMEKIHYSIDNVLQMLREKDVFDIKEVQTAIVEANGELSILKHARHQTVTRQDMNIIPYSSDIALPIIIEGDISREVLSYFGVKAVWVRRQLVKNGVKDINDVFYASLNRELELHYTLKSEVEHTIPPVQH